MSRRAWLVLLLALVPALAGCWGERRKPVPEHVITVVADGSYRFDGQAMPFDQIQDELTRLAEQNRRRITGTARVIITISAEPGVSWDRVNEVAEWCSHAGVDNVVPVGR